MSEKQDKQKQERRKEKCVLLKNSYTVEEAENCACPRCRGLKLYKKAKVLA